MTSNSKAEGRFGKQDFATFNDPCIECGVRIAYNAEATDAARKDVVEFLSKLFNK